MNEREIAEIKRRYKVDKNNITKIYGCYVNERKEVIANFEQSVALMTETRKEMYFSVMKKTLSGTLKKNLIDIEFETAQVVNGEEHKLLMELKNTKLEDKEILNSFFDKVVDSVDFEGNYLILIACDAYDVPTKSRSLQGDLDVSTESFTYVLCSICPVKQTKSALGYNVEENIFSHKEGVWAVAAPMMGFMFPSFDDRSSNIYNALYYTKDTAFGNENFVEAIFKADTPMPANLQKETFETLICDTLAEECSLESIETVHQKISNMLDIHKESKDPNALTLSAKQVKYLLEDSGVSADKLENFEENFENEFGENSTLSPKNIVDVKRYELTTPDVVIKVNPDRKDLVQTKIIDGKKYILISADEGVELNGINIHIGED